MCNKLRVCYFRLECEIMHDVDVMITMSHEYNMFLRWFCNQWLTFILKEKLKKKYYFFYINIIQYQSNQLSNEIIFIRFINL